MAIESTITNLNAVQGSSRAESLNSSAKDQRGVVVSELVVLLVCGLATAVAIAVFRGQRFGIPGHAILRVTLPIALARTLVPRRFSASIVSAMAAAAIGVFMLPGFGGVPIAALVAACGFGPLMDLATLDRFRRQHVYARIMLAGVCANLLAFAVRWGLIAAGWDAPGGSAWWYIALCYVASGAAAGALSTVIYSRRRRAPEF